MHSSLTPGNVRSSARSIPQVPTGEPELRYSCAQTDFNSV
jgi:hypothetical protein